jgi:hypothetical protein
VLVVHFHDACIVVADSMAVSKDYDMMMMSCKGIAGSEERCFGDGDGVLKLTAAVDIVAGGPVGHSAPDTECSSLAPLREGDRSPS